jgi:hypothetical protein
MYTHFGHGYVENGKLSSRFVDLMRRLRRKNGWFAPVSVLLDYLRSHRGITALEDGQRRRLEIQWLSEKVLRGTS